MSAPGTLLSLTQAAMAGAVVNYLHDGGLVPVLVILRSPRGEADVALPDLSALSHDQRRAALREACEGAVVAVLVAESDDDGIIVIGESADDRLAFYAAPADAPPIRFAQATVLVPGCSGFLKQPDA